MPRDLVTGGYWSTYWYQGRIYGTEITRGIDVFALIPSEHLTANEIAAAELANQGSVFNPQQQFPVSWPTEPIVSLAYLDQLLRSEPDLRETMTPLYETLLKAEQALDGNIQHSSLAENLSVWANEPDLASADALRDSLQAISRRLAQAPSPQIEHLGATTENP
jgi:hypothetical protein